MNLVQTPLSRLTDQIGGYYAAHPDLIVGLLQRLGADSIRPFKGEIRCTCPIHMGTNRNAFAVWFDRGYPVWRCHTDCADKGTLAKLVMKKYGSSFEQAVTWLATNAGIQISGEMLQVSKQTLDEESVEALRRRLRIISPSAQEQPNLFPEHWMQWSVANLYQPTAAKYLDYLTGPASEKTSFGETKRQMPHWIVNHFQIGFVPGGSWLWKDPIDHVMRGWKEDRISFPWRASNGHLIGFAGRRVDGFSELKYKTLPGTRRALSLWWLHDPLCIEAIKRTRVLHMLEGYTDVMRAYQHQCYNSTAIGGTELTSQQMMLVQSLNLDRVIMYLDPDGPGMVAAMKIAEQLKLTTRVYLATPPGQCDPADLVEYEQFWTPVVQARPFVSKES